MTGFLNDLGLSKASADPNFIPEGKYPAFISKLQIKDVKKKAEQGGGTGKALIITYKVTNDDPSYSGKTKTEFKSLPELNPDGSFKTDEDEKNAAYLKQRLLSIGVPSEEMDNMNQEDILGTPVWITLVASGEYVNVRQVEVREEEISSSNQI